MSEEEDICYIECSSDEINCPKCGHLIRSTDDYIVEDTDGICCGDIYSITIKCPACGAKICLEF